MGRASIMSSRLTEPETAQATSAIRISSAVRAAKTSIRARTRLSAPRVPALMICSASAR